MHFSKPLVEGILLKRYKRFLSDIKLSNGEIIIAHCTNSGSMKSCLEENARVYISPVDDPNRKTKFTWEMIEINNSWVGINTANPNQIAFESVQKNLIPELSGYDIVKREVKFGDSRFDIMAENANEICFVEVKNVTYKNGDYALFPDAITSRGLKHLNTLREVKAAGYRAVMLYVIQRVDVKIFGPAADIDIEYTKGLKEAMNAGVEILAYQVKVSPEEIQIFRKLPVEI